MHRRSWGKHRLVFLLAKKYNAKVIAFVEVLPEASVCNRQRGLTHFPDRKRRDNIRRSNEKENAMENIGNGGMEYFGLL